MLEPSQEDLPGIHSVPVVERFYPAGTLIMEEGQVATRSLVMVTAGWAISYKSMQNGQRVVVDFPLRGDLINHGSPAGRAYRSVLAQTDLVTFEINIERQGLLSGYSPFLARSIMSLVARNYGIAMEHLANVARRRPLERAAYLLLEIAYRLERAETLKHNRFQFPFTQSDLADALGLTAIHTNRVLRDLREAELIVVRNGVVELVDKPGLIDMTFFDPAYLSYGG